VTRIVRSPPSRGRRIEGALYEAGASARAILAEAEQHAACVRAQAEAERERARREAEEAGRRDGLAHAAAALAAVAAEQERLRRGLAGEVVALALEVARKVLGREVAQDPAAVMELARRALGEVRRRRDVTLRVNPGDAPRFRVEQGRLAALLERAPCLGIREDPSVDPGGVIVETEAGRIDARIETQLALLERALGGVEL